MAHRVANRRVKRTIADGVTQGTLGYATNDETVQLKLVRFNNSLHEADVEIADDMYLLKAADAQKLLEPPRLARVAVCPEHVVLTTGEQAAFRCTALDQYDQPVELPPIAWSSTGGPITETGLYTAGANGGLHQVAAKANGHEAIAEVRIRTPDEAPVGGPADAEEHVPGKRTVSWRGTVPPQKWMNFYTKVLTKFASHPELTLEVGFHVPLDQDQAQMKSDETRTSLKNLGLDDDVTCI